MDQLRKNKLRALLPMLILTGMPFIIYNFPVDKPINIFYNQVGYLPFYEKTFIVELDESIITQSLSFSILNETGDPIIYNKEISYLGELWNKYYGMGNFTELNDPGNYSILIIHGPQKFQTDLFEISESVYNIALERAVQFYYYQRCGYAPNTIVPNYVGHKSCHMDDGIWMNIDGVDTWINLSGGWHDAGDYGKYTEFVANTQLSVFALTLGYQLNTAFWKNIAQNLYETNAPDIVDEAVWGAQFLQKMTVLDSNGDARLFSNVFATKPDGSYNRFGYWGEPSSETDNIAMTGDERTVGSLWNVSGMVECQFHTYGPQFVEVAPALMAAAALANTANIMRDYSYWDLTNYKPENLIANATALYNSHINFSLDTDNSIRESATFESLICSLLTISSLMDWANYTHNNLEFNKYLEAGMSIWEQLIFGGDKKIKSDTDLHWWENYYAIIAVWMFENMVNGTNTQEFKDLITDWAYTTYLPQVNLTGNFFHYAKADNYYFSYWGANIPVCSSSIGSILAWNATGGTEEYLWMKNFAFDNTIHWIMGRNPIGICQIESLGSKNLPIYHNRLINMPRNARGEVLGAVPNGIAKPALSKSYISQFTNEYEAYDNSPDLPWFDLRIPNPKTGDLGDFRSNEVYITNNAHFLLGISFVKAYSNF